ncbi:MAG: FtsX-like permease family protein [Lachnospiraceae bacterium]
MSRLEKMIPEQLATCTAYFLYDVYMQDEGIAKLQEKYRIIVSCEQDIDIEKSKDVLNTKYISEHERTISISAIKGNTLDHGCKYGSVDVAEVENGLVLSEDLMYVDLSKVKEQSNPKLYADGIEYNIIGVHTTADDSYMNYDYMYNNNMKINKIEVTLLENRSKDNILNMKSEIEGLFNKDYTYVKTPYELYDEYFGKENEVKKKNILTAIILMSISFFVFLFVLKYIFDMDIRENTIERIVGATRGYVGFIAYCEVLILTLMGTLITILVHMLLYDRFFKNLSDYVNLVYSTSDYVIIAAFALFVMTVVSIPMIISLCVRPTTNIER